MLACQIIQDAVTTTSGAAIGTTDRVGGVAISGRVIAVLIEFSVEDTVATTAGFAVVAAAVDVGDVAIARGIVAFFVEKRIDDAVAAASRQTIFAT